MLIIAGRYSGRSQAAIYDVEKEAFTLMPDFPKPVSFPAIAALKGLEQIG